MKATLSPDGMLTITVDTQDPTPSASGKTLIVATTGGGKPSEVKINGKPVTISVNAWIKQ